jgi:hypothetical protein
MPSLLAKDDGACVFDGFRFKNDVFGGLSLKRAALGLFDFKGDLFRLLTVDEIGSTISESISVKCDKSDTSEWYPALENSLIGDSKHVGSKI